MDEAKVPHLDGGAEILNRDATEASTTPMSESACGRLIRRAFTLHELPSLIEAIFSSEDEGDTISRLLGDDAQAFIDVIDEALDVPNLSPQTRNKCLKSLYRICGHHALLPRALKIQISYNQTGDALYRGGFADVWKGDHTVVGTLLSRFCKEVVTWKTLQHPNILPLMGVVMSETRFAMVSDWMVNGNINDFVKVHPDANRLELLGGVTRGLIYIHGQGMVHGDLKGANVLIDQTGRARLADFGLLTIISDPASLLPSSSYTQGGTARWMSPEHIAPHRFGFEDSRPTKSSDCYALGMVIYETISGNLPFHKDSDLTVFMKVVEGERPPRGMKFTKGLWKMLELCWAKPTGRPSTEDILQCLEMVSNLSNGQASQSIGANGMGESVFTGSGHGASGSGKHTTEPGIVRVTIIEAKDYNPHGESLKPYVILKSGDEEHKTSHRPRSAGAECSWKEQCSFVVNPGQPKIQLWVHSRKAISRDKLLGAGEIDLWRHLNPANGINATEVLIQLTKGQGLLKVRLDYSQEDFHHLPRGSSFQSLADATNPEAVSSPSFSLQGKRPEWDPPIPQPHMIPPGYPPMPTFRPYPPPPLGMQGPPGPYNPQIYPNFEDTDYYSSDLSDPQSPAKIFGVSSSIVNNLRPAPTPRDREDSDES